MSRRLSSKLGSLGNARVASGADFAIAQNEHRLVITNTIREHRKQKGISQVQLAVMIGVSRQTNLSMEFGRRTPSLEVAFKAAQALGAAICELFSYELRHRFQPAQYKALPARFAGCGTYTLFV